MLLDIKYSSFDFLVIVGDGSLTGKLSGIIEVSHAKT